MTEKIQTMGNIDINLSNVDEILHIEHLQKVFEQDLNAHRFPCHISEEEIVKTFCAEADLIDDDQPFYIINLSHLIEQTKNWKDKLNGIEPFYAVKCNPNHFLIRILSELNVNFDCASEEELNLIIQTSPHIDCANRIIYAHPCKPISHIRRFRAAGVRLTVVDNTDELYKINKYWPEAKVLIRLKVDDTTSLLPLSYKFGADEDQCIKLMQLAIELNIDLVGCSFHAGTPCHSPLSYERAIHMAHRLFNIAYEQFNISFNILDIGGGFNPENSISSHLETTTSNSTFTTIASTIQLTINQLFPLSRGVRLIAEPGRYFVEGCATFVCRIIGRRRWKENDEIIRKKMKSECLIKNPLFLTNNNGESKRISLSIDNSDVMYYLNEGIYGIFFSFLLEPDLAFRIHWLKRQNNEEEDCEIYRSVLFGPTCDSRDLITPSIDLPLLDIGDIFYVTNAGSYTNACASCFNGFFVQKYVLIYRK